MKFQLIIHWATTKKRSKGFLADIRPVWCDDSKKKNDIGFAQSGQLFEPSPHYVLYIFVTFSIYYWLTGIFLLQMNEMSSGRRACRNKTDVFCYIFGEYTIVSNRNPVTKFIKRANHTYFGTKLVDQYKAWPPHMVCKTCTEYLRRWTNGNKSCLKFGIPMVWR